MYQGRVLKPGTRVIDRNRHGTGPDRAGFVQGQKGDVVFFTEAEDGSGQVLVTGIGTLEVLNPDAWTDEEGQR